MSESPIRFIDPPSPNPRVLAYEIVGDMTGDDMRVFIERLEKITESGEKALLYQDITGRGHFDLETVKVKFQNMGTIWKGIEKVALIGDAKWLDIYISVIDHLTPQDMKYFDATEKQAAFEWLTS